MPSDLKRFYGLGSARFITASCYRRLPLFTPEHRKDLFLTYLEEVRNRFAFAVFGYVVMPEHMHLLIGEPAIANLSLVMQILKQDLTRELLRRQAGCGSPWEPALPQAGDGTPHFWLPRSYDFNVFTIRKFREKLRYIHENPVKRGLVESPEHWRWSSYRHYAYGEPTPVLLGLVSKDRTGGKTESGATMTPRQGTLT